MGINVGIADRVIRVWLGIALMLFAFMQPDVSYAFLGWIGIVPFVTGLAGRCMLYRFLGISTVKNG